MGSNVTMITDPRSFGESCQFSDSAYRCYDTLAIYQPEGRALCAEALFHGNYSNSGVCDIDLAVSHMQAVKGYLE